MAEVDETARLDAIGPDDLEVALRVLGAAQHLEDDDPTYVALRHACGTFYKDVKKQRRRAKREAVAAADRARVLGRPSDG